MASLLPHHQQPDHAVREMESACPRLRNDLRLRFQEFSGQPGYLLEDPVQGRFFRLGEREYQFVRALDGTKRIGQIVAQLAARSGGASPGRMLRVRGVSRVLTDTPPGARPGPPGAGPGGGPRRSSGPARRRSIPGTPSAGG